MSVFASPIVERIGWILLHSSWLLVIPAVMFSVLLWLTPSSYSRLRYAAGLGTLVVMAFLPILSATFVNVTEVVASNEEGGVSQVSASVDRELSVVNEVDSIERTEPNVPIGNSPVELPSDQRRIDSVPGANAAGVAVVVNPKRPELSEQASASPDQSNRPLSERVGVSSPFVRLILSVKPFLPLAVAGWMVGVLLMSFRLLLGWRSARRLKREGVQPVPETIETLFDELKQRIGGCKAACVVESALVAVPSIVGHFRPVVLLPLSALTGLSEGQLSAILAHELAHVRRHDYLVNICQTVVETLLFYHPAVWFVSRCVREEREHCCDDIALQNGCQASELARALVTVEAIRPTDGQGLIDSPLIPAADGGSLLLRVRRLAGCTSDKHVAGRSWIAGGFALSLLVAALLASATSVKSVAQEDQPLIIDGEKAEDASVTAAESGVLNGGRIDFANGYFVELAAIGELTRPESDTAAVTAWTASGSVIERPPFYGIQVRPGFEVAENKIARKFYLRARMPADTEIQLDTDGETGSGSVVQRSSKPLHADIEASVLAVLPKDQKTIDLTVKLQLPSWKTLASFDFAGGVKNGVIMDWERKVSEFSRYTATGDFGTDATKDNIRVIAFDPKHRQLEATQTSSKGNEEGLTELSVAFKNSDGRPSHIVVQKRIATHPIVFRGVPLSPGKHRGVGVTVQGKLLAGSAAPLQGDFVTTNDPQQVAGASPPNLGQAERDESDLTIWIANKSHPLSTLLAEPMEPLSAKLPGAGTFQLVSVREAGSDLAGWHADGSPRLVPYSDEKMWLMRPSTDDRHRKLEAMFEFVASSPEVRVGKIQISPEDGSGSTSLKPIQVGENNVSGVRLLQALNILDDRETEDFVVDVFAGPLSKLTTLPIGDPPEDFADQSWLSYKPDAETKDFAFHISEPKETKAGWRHVLLLVLPEEAPQGSVLTAITADGQKVAGFTSSTTGRKILGVFNLPWEQNIESVEVATQPQHSMVFRNVSVWSGLGSSAFVDKPEPAAMDFESLTPSRVFLRPDGERIAEQDGVGVGVSPALQSMHEIERRGGLFRFDAQAESPSGENLPYLTEIRWRDFRADELRWVRALAGLTRLDLSSEFMNDESLQSIAHLSTLQQLELSRSRHLTTACLRSIGELTDLRELQLVSSLKWDDEDYDADDFNRLRNLTKIVEWKPYDWRLDDAGIAWLKAADELEMVYGWGPAVTDEGFAALANKPMLGVIHLNTTKITDRSYELLKDHPKLYWLQCSSPNLTDAAIDSITTMRNLREVHLFESKVTDVGVQKLIDALDQLPRLETVNLSNTAVSQDAVEKLRAARQGLRVLASPPPSSEKTEELNAKKLETPATTNSDSPDSPVSAEEERQADSPLSATAPRSVPWPDEKWTKSLPPSGSGIRVKLDGRRWVEFNSVYATQKVNGERTKIHWTADGELIEPLADFDPKSLVPDRDGGEMPSVTRGFLMQVVGPKGTRFDLDTSGSGGYGKTEHPVDDSFVQIPVDTIASSIGYNHAYVEVKVSQDVKEFISIDDSGFQLLSDPDEKRLFVATSNARDFAWRLKIVRDGEALEVEPFLVGGIAESNSYLSDELKSSLKDNFRKAQILGFAFDKDQPLPELISLERSPYDTVRFDNLSVFPGPRTAVVVSVNGVPIDDENRPKIESNEEVDLDDSNGDLANDEELETVTLTGTVVDENGIGIADCWVGLFIQPQEHYGQSTRSPPWAKEPLSAFGYGPPLTLETQTNALGQFTFDAPKTHFVFEGQFWAMRPDGTLGMKWMNAVWSHVQQPKNLNLTIRDEEATVRVIDQDGEPVADADVTLQAYRIPRSVTHLLPESVQQRMVSKTNSAGEVTFGGMETAALRGVKVSAKGIGTQFLSDRLASEWVQGDQPLTLKLQPTARLAGRVINFDPQLDLGLKLKARTEQNDGRPPMYGQEIAEVKPDGTFDFEHLVAGWVSLESSLPPESQRKIRFQFIPQMTAGEDRTLDATQNPQMVPAVVVRQRLIKSDTGEGIPDARLSVLWGDPGNGGRFQQSRAVTTDANGWWMARVLPGTINLRLGTIPDGYRSTAWFDGRNGRSGVKAIVPATDKLVTLPPERYVPAVELTGKLQFADGSPADDWSVNGHPVSWDDLGLGAVRTGKDGSFTLTHPTGYPPRFFSSSNRQWMTEHDFTDRYVKPKLISSDPLVLEIPGPKTQVPE
ncbi:M56 family metallopeptidase [Novipirellula rosea]|uniref:Peptidase M56 domain-containing protein n=1 Tax=Novipirellula rosea TaxID=1031540 RepID=A0ABP8MQD0_9BACT